jgi:hypothetical protein
MKNILMKLVIFLFFATLFNMPLFSQADRNREVSDYYFPLNTFSERGNVEAQLQTWYGRNLDVLDNENLTRLGANINALRFICLRAFHRPFSIKLLWTADNAKLEYSMSDGRGGYEPGELTTHFSRMIGRNQIDELMRLVNRHDLFNQPTVLSSDRGGMDGSKWILEANINGQYKVIDRWTPNSGINYIIGNYLITLSGERIDNLY